MELKLKRFSYVVTAFIFSYVVYSISTLLLKYGFDGASREFFFVTLSLYLCSPLVKYIKIKSVIDKEEIEENYRINKISKTLKGKGDIMEDIILKGAEEVKIENLIITNKGVFNIAKCNYVGKISIDRNNRWYIGSLGFKSEVFSPLIKLKKNREYLKAYFKEDQIIDVIVMVKDRATLEGGEFSDAPVIFYEDFEKFIEDYESEDFWNKDKLYDKLYKYIVKVKDLKKEKEIYDQFVNDRWLFRSRLTFVSVFLIFYILTVIYKI